MKRTILLFCAILGLCRGVVLGQKDPIEVLAALDAAMEKNSYKAMMKWVDPAYTATQHDQFLQGNTRQFINELLEAYTDISEGAYRAIQLTDIRQTVLVSFELHATGGTAVFKTLLADKSVVYVFFNLTENSGNLKVVGAVG